MKKFSWLSLGFGVCLSLSAYTAAPVVDESENFALLDEQTVSEPSASEAQPSEASTVYNDDDEIALARDDTPSSTQKSTDLLNKIKGMQQEIQELRGQLEQQGHELKQLQQQQLSFYKDIDARLQGNKANATPLAQQKAPLVLDTDNGAQAKTNTGLKTSSRTNPADEQISYLAAYDLVKNKQFDQALTAMQDFVTHYPRGGYTANAHYWLGELYMIKQQYSEAIGQFESVLTNFPSSSKTAACSLKIGYALAASGHDLEAKKRLQQVVKNYPDTPTAQLAAQKLRTL